MQREKPRGQDIYDPLVISFFHHNENLQQSLEETISLKKNLIYHLKKYIYFPN